MAIAIVLVLLVIGSLIFHFVSPWWFTPLASNWQSVDDTITISLWVVGIVFVLVGLFLAYVVYKYRHQSSRRAEYDPENKKLEIWLTVFTTAGVIAMLAPGLVVWADFINVPENSTEVEVLGQQWSWSYRLPGKDDKLGKTHADFITENNPFGIDPLDINGADDLLVMDNQLHLQVSQPTKMLLRSKDVLHNFAVPQFRVKMDLVPGIVTYVWFTPTKTGAYEVLCEELCGMAHYTMRSKVIVDDTQDYQLWLSTLPTFAETQQQQHANIELGKQVYQSCIACHGEQGQGSTQLNAPALAGLGQSYIARQLRYFKSGVRGGEGADQFAQQMASMSVVLSNDEAIHNVSAYINQLPVESATNLQSYIPHTRSNAALATPINKGKALYRNCSYCHGDMAQGNYAMYAPRLAGQHPDYLKRQILAYQSGQRGVHAKDVFGNQMRLMASILKDESAIDNVVLYINTLTSEAKE
ncbi:c-type cytochrome [Thalassotalea fusca]